MLRSIEISKDIVVLGPEMFASSDLKVIAYKGDNYYRACGEMVVKDLPDAGGQSTCLKPEGHLISEHEDVYGFTRSREFGVEDMEFKIRDSAHRLLRRTGIEDTEIFNVLNALQYAGFSLVRGK